MPERPCESSQALTIRLRMPQLVAMQATDTNWFNDVMQAKQLSQRGLAKLLGCNASSVNRLINGKRPMRLDEAEQLAVLLGVKVGDVLAHAGVEIETGERAGTPGGRQTYIVGYIDGHREAHIDWNSRDELIAAPLELPPSTVAVQYRTAMTALESLDGWTLYLEPPDGKIDHALNRLSLITMENGITTVGFLRRGYKPGLYNITNVNARGYEDVVITWATPILLLRP